MLVKIAVLVIFFAIMIAVGIYTRSKVKNVSDFVLGGRDVGPWLTAFAYGTTYFSAVVFVGYAGQFGYNFGVSATWIGIGNAFLGSLFAWVVLGRRTRLMTKHLEVATMPEFFEKRYDSRVLKIISSLIVFIFLVPYSASVYKGLSGLFSMAFGISFTYCIIGMAVLTAVYVVMGGYLATAINDFIQGIIMLFGIAAIIWAVLEGKGGFTAAIASLSQIPNPKTPELFGSFTSFFGPDPLNILGVIILTSLGTWGLPQMIHKFYTIKSEKAIKTGTVISTIFALVIAGGSYFMGAFGRLYYTAPEGGKPVFDQIVPQMLSGLPDVLIAVAVILVLSASMSTLSSLVLTSSSTFTIDFIKGFVVKNLNHKKELLIIRILCVIFIALSAIIALNPNSLITSLMSISWGALAGAFLGPFLYGLFSKKSTRGGVYASFVSGISVTTIGLILQLNKIELPGLLQKFNSPINFGAFAIVLSLIIMPLFSAITPKLKKEVVDDAFVSLEETVVTKHQFKLAENEDN